MRIRRIKAVDFTPPPIGIKEPALEAIRAQAA
jgi:hypothetical protein